MKTLSALALLLAASFSEGAGHSTGCHPEILSTGPTHSTVASTTSAPPVPIVHSPTPAGDPQIDPLLSNPVWTAVNHAQLEGRLDEKEWKQFERALAENPATHRLPEGRVDAFVKGLLAPDRNGRLKSHAEIARELRRFADNLSSFDAPISLKGNELRQQVEPLKRADWMDTKFPPPENSNRLYDNSQSFFTGVKTPEELLQLPNVKAALHDLNAYTSKQDGIPTDQIYTDGGRKRKSDSEIMKLWLPPAAIEALAKLGVTGAEYTKDSEGNKLRVSFKDPGDFGYDAILGGLKPGQAASTRLSDSKYTATPQSRGTSKPTHDFSIVIATDRQGTVQLRDVFAGQYAESGPPTAIAQLLFDRPAGIPPDQWQRDWNKRKKAAIEKFRRDKAAGETYAEHWEEPELVRCIEDWSTKARAARRGVESETPLAEMPHAKSAPANTQNFSPADLKGAQEEGPILTDSNRRHLEGEVVIGQDGKAHIEGMHLHLIYEMAIKRGDGPGGPDNPYWLEADAIRDRTGQREKDDNGRNMKAAIQNVNPDGVTVTARIGMDSPDGTPLKAKPCTLFPRLWKMEQVDAAARLLLQTPPNEVGPTGTKSHFGFFPADPDRPIGTDNPGFAVQIFVGADGEIYTIFPPGKLEPIPVD